MYVKKESAGFSMASISLLIADDHQVVQLGLKNLLEGTNIAVVAEANTGEEVLSKVASHKPNVVLLDVPSRRFFKPSRTT